MLLKFARRCLAPRLRTGCRRRRSRASSLLWRRVSPVAASHISRGRDARAPGLARSAAGRRLEWLGARRRLSLSLSLSLSPRGTRPTRRGLAGGKIGEPVQARAAPPVGVDPVASAAFGENSLLNTVSVSAATGIRRIAMGAGGAQPTKKQVWRASTRRPSLARAAAHQARRS